jgi:hypothetical protein
LVKIKSCQNFIFHDFQHFDNNKIDNSSSNILLMNKFDEDNNLSKSVSRDLLNKYNEKCKNNIYIIYFKFKYLNILNSSY